MGPKKKQQPKQQAEEPPPRRDIVRLTDNLPKIPIKHRIEQITQIASEDPYIIEKYIPEQKKRKYQKNFDLFDRNHDQLLQYEQVKEFLISIGEMITEDDLKEFYKEMYVKQGSSEGLELKSIEKIVLEKKREEDQEEQLRQAFAIVLEGKKQAIPSDDFKEFLMTMGYKWPEDLADEFLKEFESKSDKKITPNQVIKKLMKK